MKRFDLSIVTDATDTIDLDPDAPALAIEAHPRTTYKLFDGNLAIDEFVDLANTLVKGE